MCNVLVRVSLRHVDRTIIGSLYGFGCCDGRGLAINTLDCLLASVDTCLTLASSPNPATAISLIRNFMRNSWFVSILSCVAGFALLMPQGGRADCPTFTVGPSNLPVAVVGMSYLQPTANRTWTSASSMVSPRQFPIGSVLNDGRVFVCNGFWASGDYANCEIYNPTNGEWTSTQPMIQSVRERGGGFSATVLQNGKVLVFGGDESFGTSDATEIYDPATDSWESAPTPAAAVRWSHTATLLQSGNVLVTGGQDLNSSEGNLLQTAWIFNPTTESWTQTGSMHVGRAFHHATLLLDGQVLITDDGGVAELFNPSTGNFVLTDAPSEVTGTCVTLLQNGNVLACGGANDGGRAAIFDWTTKTWRETARLHYPRWNHSATLLADGRVMVFGGTDETNGVVHACEMFDPATELWTVVDSSSLNGGTVVSLNDGTVLAFGDGSNDAQLFGAVAVSAIGNATPVTYQVTDGSLPRGVTLTKTGILVGSAFQIGDFTFTITGTDGSGCTGDGTVSIKVKAAGAITLSDLTQNYDGNPKSVSFTTVPAGLNVQVSYNGSNTPPTETGTYNVVAIIDDPVYAGMASAKFSINCGADLAHVIPLPAVYFGSNFSITLGGVMEGGHTSVQRERHTVTILQDGRFLAVGGSHVWYEDSESLQTAEVCDPNTALWTTVAPPLAQRGDHCAALLNDGRVLIAGGRTALFYHWWLQTAEIYDPISNKWTAVNRLMLTNHPAGTATTLPNGKVLVAGGGTSELFDPATGSWGTLTPMNAPRAPQSSPWTGEPPSAQIPRFCYRTAKQWSSGTVRRKFMIRPRTPGCSQAQCIRRRVVERCFFRTERCWLWPVL